MTKEPSPVVALTAWMENLSGAPPRELRAIRRELGHDVEKSEREFLALIREKNSALVDNSEGE